jgi:acyl carrier protein
MKQLDQRIDQHWQNRSSGKNIMSSNLLNVIANTMEVQLTEIDDESGPETIENWDSFRGLVLFEELERKYEVKFTLNELLKIKKITDIKYILSLRGVSVG